MRLFRILFALFFVITAATAHALEIKPYTAAALAVAQQTNRRSVNPRCTRLGTIRGMPHEY